MGINEDAAKGNGKENASQQSGSVFEKYLKIGAEALNAIAEDAETLARKAGQKLESIVDSVLDDEKLNNLGRTVYDNAAKGKDAVSEALKREYNSLDDYLERKAKTNPGLVGFWDGFASAYLGNKAERRADSKDYTTYVTYGKATGYASAALLFVKGKGFVAKTVGSMPVWTRAARYLSKKLKEAEEKVAKAAS